MGQVTADPGGGKGGSEERHCSSQVWSRVAVTVARFSGQELPTPEVAVEGPYFDYLVPCSSATIELLLDSSKGPAFMMAITANFDTFYIRPVNIINFTP